MNKKISKVIKIALVVLMTVKEKGTTFVTN